VTLNGAFDQVSKTASFAQYEVLFTTMHYDPNDVSPSPGSVLAEDLAKLYQKVRENPQDFPRGMTVRILLGNYPVMANFQWGGQIIDAIIDFRNAGVDKLVDPEIGWRLEIANFPGTYPHSHTKFLVVDGKTIMSAGFNYGYFHFTSDHPTGKGLDMLDLGVQVTGPVAQDGISTFDDMWEGADQIHCEDLSLTNENWKDTCQEVKAQSDHVPEVLSYYLPPEGDSNAFSLYRSQKYKEGDEFIAITLASAQESVDMMQVNFSLDIVCMLNLIYPDFCTIDNALPYMYALLEAIETNNVQVRVIMENTNSNGLENRIGGIVFMQELERLGLSDLVELRFYDGKLHAKSTLIDGQFLMIGSHNMHYSSWGQNGLTEHTLMTNDPRAAAEYQALFEAKWQNAIPFAEAKYGTSP
jgi:phosphatidylserine/phosphatidylglycerophosphate/cardiolipin synthase-like enzyme